MRIARNPPNYSMSNNNFNSRFRLFLESIEEEQQLNELQSSLGFKSLGLGTASSNDLAGDARSAVSTNAFSGKEWSPQEKAIFRIVNQLFRHMIENGDIMRIVPELRRFFPVCFSKLGIEPPEPENTDKTKEAGSLAIGGKPLR